MAGDPPCLDTPLELPAAEWQRLKGFAAAVWQATADALAAHLRTPAADLPAWMTDQYGALRDLWHGAGADPRLDTMRLDLGWTDEGEPRTLELNAWTQWGWFSLEPMAARTLPSRQDHSLAPDPERLVSHLLHRLGRRIALIAAGSQVLAELEELAGRLARRGAAAEIIDPLPDGGARLRAFAPSGLLLKVCDPQLLVRHADLIRWLAGLPLPRVPEFPSLFIADDKTFLSEVQRHCPRPVVPATVPLPRYLNGETAGITRARAVVKPAHRMRGDGVAYGADFTDAAWADHLAGLHTASPDAWIVQERCRLRTLPDGRYGDLSVFLVDGHVAGAFARVSPYRTVNHGQGGAVQLVVTDAGESSRPTADGRPPARRGRTRSRG
ncbi:hypothetical protein MUU72_26595 [Streptomyces sp. RS10V-4]|uniref:hypothetical protein n=1 Tax=Streptomyces rhizoryzae TaxID=2932493 RepID=UPI0020052CC1|nr:hypothetical protein [Streptomyces rhizoryzae]MCK7626628.1 hypothetical protein [Streptomyces rhizoryzae]